MRPASKTSTGGSTPTLSTYVRSSGMLKMERNQVSIWNAQGRSRKAAKAIAFSTFETASRPLLRLLLSLHFDLSITPTNHAYTHSNPRNSIGSHSPHASFSLRLRRRYAYQKYHTRHFTTIGLRRHGHIHRQRTTPLLP